MRFRTRVPADRFPALPAPGEFIALVTNGKDVRHVQVLAVEQDGDELVLDLLLPSSVVVPFGSAVPKTEVPVSGHVLEYRAGQMTPDELARTPGLAETRRFIADLKARGRSIDR